MGRLPKGWKRKGSGVWCYHGPNKGKLNKKRKRKKNRRSNSGPMTWGRWTASGKSYKDYLKTEHWRAFRSSMIQLAGGCCERCGCRCEGLHVHHLTYKNIFREKSEDVLVLCPHCHAESHAYPECSELDLEFMRIVRGSL